MKALCVFSGGLDSILATEVIRLQGIDVLGLFFETPFFTPEKAKKSAAAIQLPLKVVNITDVHLTMVKNPRHGYGENMNPCIDCHALMIRCAGELLETLGADFIITGEVLGQRPMSQNRKALDTVASESGVGGLLLRPLSARHLRMTIPEKEGWVDREALRDWSGRSRKPQMALAKELGIEEYPLPAGGCLLTDKLFSRRIRDLLSYSPHCAVREIELLKIGRHFRIFPGTKLVVGRNKKENETIQGLAAPGDLILKSVSTPGPTVLALGEMSPDAEALAAAITVSYSDADDHQESEVRLIGNNTDRIVLATGCEKEEFRRYMI